MVSENLEIFFNNWNLESFNYAIKIVINILHLEKNINKAYTKILLYCSNTDFAA